MDANPAANVTSGYNNSSTLPKCALSVPYSTTFIENINPVEKTFIFISALATFFIIAEFVSKVFFVFRNYQTTTDIKIKSVQTLGIYPAVSLAMLFSLFVPRADMVCELLVNVYLARCMFNFVTLMTHYFGGKQKMLDCLKEERIVYQTPPCCCCCCCLPTSPVTNKTQRIPKYLVLQAAIIQPIIVSAAFFMWIDGRYVSGQFVAHNAFPYLMTAMMTSVFLSIWGFYIYFRLCRNFLRPLFIVPKFFAIQFIIVLTRIQTVLFNILAINGIPACTNVIPTSTRGLTYYKIIVILEVLLLSMVARHFYVQTHVNVGDQILIVKIASDKENKKKNRKRGKGSSGKESGLTDSKAIKVYDSMVPLKKVYERKDSGIIEDLSWLRQQDFDRCRESDV